MPAIQILMPIAEEEDKASFPRFFGENYISKKFLKFFSKKG